MSFFRDFWGGGPLKIVCSIVSYVKVRSLDFFIPSTHIPSNWRRSLKSSFWNYLIPCYSFPEVCFDPLVAFVRHLGTFSLFSRPSSNVLPSRHSITVVPEIYLKVLLVVFKILLLKCQPAPVSTTVCYDNKKNVVSPYLDTLCSPLVKKVKINKKNNKMFCLLSRPQNFENNFSVTRLVTILDYGVLLSQNHLVRFKKNQASSPLSWL